MQRKVFNKNIEISVQEIMKSAIIPLKSFRIPEIIIVKFDEQEKKKKKEWYWIYQVLNPKCFHATFWFDC